MNFTSLNTALRDPKRWKRWAVEILIITAMFGGITTWQNSGLASGKAPPLAGTRTDGAQMKVGSGETALCGVLGDLVRRLQGRGPQHRGRGAGLAGNFGGDAVGRARRDRRTTSRNATLRLPAIADDDSDIFGSLGRARRARAFRRRCRRQHPLPRRRLHDDLGTTRATLVGEKHPGLTPPPLRLAWTVWGLGALLYLSASTSASRRR